MTLWEHGIDARGRDYKLYKLVGGALFLVAKYLRFTFASVGNGQHTIKRNAAVKGILQIERYFD